MRYIITRSQISQQCTVPQIDHFSSHHQVFRFRNEGHGSDGTTAHSAMHSYLTQWILSNTAHPPVQWQSTNPAQFTSGTNEINLSYWWSGYFESTHIQDQCLCASSTLNTLSLSVTIMNSEFTYLVVFANRVLWFTTWYIDILHSYLIPVVCGRHSR